MDAENMADKLTTRTCELPNCALPPSALRPRMHCPRATSASYFKLERPGSFRYRYTNCAHAQLQICRAAVKVPLIDVPHLRFEISPDFCPTETPNPRGKDG